MCVCVCVSELRFIFHWLHWQAFNILDGKHQLAQNNDTIIEFLVALLHPDSALASHRMPNNGKHKTKTKRKLSTFANITVNIHWYDCYASRKLYCLVDLLSHYPRIYCAHPFPWPNAFFLSFLRVVPVVLIFRALVAQAQHRHSLALEVGSWRNDTEPNPISSASSEFSCPSTAIKWKHKSNESNDSINV